MRKQITSLSHNHSILLVEDDPDDVLLVREALEASPTIKLIHEKNGFEALNYLNELKAKALAKPCLIILDINMPIINGKQLLVQLKNEDFFKDIPVIVFTTSSNERDKEYCQSFGVPMITKPYDGKIFCSTVQKFIEQCHSD